MTDTTTLVRYSHGAVAIGALLLLLISTGGVDAIRFTATFATASDAERWARNLTVDVISNASNFGPPVIQFEFSDYVNVSDPEYALDLPSNLIIFRREDWLMDIASDKQRLLSEYGIYSIGFSWSTPEPATAVPAPVTASPSNPFPTGSLRFTLRCDYTGRYTNLNGGLRMEQRGPNSTLVQHTAAKLAGIPSSDVSRVRLISFPDGLPTDRMMRLFYSPLGYYVAFEVDEASGTQQSTPTAQQVTRRLIFLAETNQLLPAFEGGVAFDWKESSAILTFDSIAEMGKDEYFDEKVMFFIGLVVTFLFIVGGLVALWYGSKTATP